ncbi:MAG: type II toxin-antitoxin system MqsA family antitoxin [Candidatus Omnitrophica bacterium]|nr:type II toxin-antitoxin system MqsA family antitoxin [Candidatus Omnitrophota bacterium]
MFKKDNCPLCGGKKQLGKTNFTVSLGEGILVVRDVPALVCGQCGEDWIEDKTALRLEKIADEARKKHLQIEVAAF